MPSIAIVTLNSLNNTKYKEINEILHNAANTPLCLFLIIIYTNNKANTTATYKGKYIGAPNIYGDDNDLTVDPTEEETTDDDTTNDDTSNTTNSVNPLSMGRSTSNTIDGKSSETQDTSKGAEKSENEENNEINSEDDETKTTEESESSEDSSSISGDT